MQSLAGLEKLTGLTSLTLDASGSQVQSLAGLEKLTGLTSLTLHLGDSQVQSLEGLEKLTQLTSLTLYAGNSQVRNLAGLEKLAKLETLELQVPASMALAQNDMKDKQSITNLTILVSMGDNLRIPEGFKFVDVKFVQ